MSRLFGTDGIRGKANVAPMDSETVMLLGRAAAYALRQSKGRHRILIGKDTRVSGYMLETALASGITSMGVDVLLVGPLPTPGVAFMTRSMRADAGVMISASHNPYEDNGIKFFGPDGFKLADSTEEEIERLMEPGHLDELRASPGLIGKAFRVDDAIGRYTVYLKSCVERECKFDGLKVALDTANGAAYKVAPMTFTELGATVSLIGDRPDGQNINAGCGSTSTDALSQLVKETGSDIGIAYDGDADRAIFCDEKGQIVDGDLVLAICGLDFKKRGILQGDGIAATVMSNLGLEKMLQEEGLKLYRADVGDRNVLLEMKNQGLNLGGEQSGHVICLDHNTTGDGILTSLVLLSVLIRSGKRLSEFQDLIQRYPQKLVNINVASKPPLEEVPNISEALDLARARLSNSGRVLFRYSGTEPKARIMVECVDEQLCNAVISELKVIIENELGV